MTFRPELFTSPSHYEETPLCDRKQELYNLSKYERKAKFLEHVIAFANSARAIGQPARMLFGIRNDGVICGLTIAKETPEGDEHNEILDWENVRRAIGQAIFEYVEPELSGCQFEHGDVAGKEVAYLLIPPVASHQRYHIKKDYPRRNPLLKKGQCWIRFGESKQSIHWKPISLDDQGQPYSYSYAEIPYILPSYWIKYFDVLARNEQLVKATSIVGYQDPLSSNEERMDTQMLRFLANSDRILVIKGLAGVGKSAFLLRQMASLIEANAIAMREIAKREEFQGPQEWIPLWLTLRGQSIDNIEQLEMLVLDVVHSTEAFWSGTQPQHPEHLFQYPELKWLICFDGLDEIWSDPSQRRFLGALHHFIHRFPRVKVVLTTRPEAVEQDWQHWPTPMVAQMAPMTHEMVLDYVSSQIKEESAQEQYEEIVDALSSNGDLWQLCSFPVCLEAAMKEFADVYPQPLEEATTPEDELYFENTGEGVQSEFTGPTDSSLEYSATQPQAVNVDELIVTVADPTLESSVDYDDSKEIIPSIRVGRIVSGLYLRLWQREVKRRAIRQMQADRWWDGTGKLALQTDGQELSFVRDRARSALGSERAIFWLLNLGILDRNSQPGLLTYRTQLTKAYFAASFLEHRLENRHTQRVYKQTTTDFREKLLSILADISTVDITQLSF